ncbi:hypothetical protein Agub_g1614, partial [Astrephomene gubernaculifera]
GDRVLGRMLVALIRLGHVLSPELLEELEHYLAGRLAAQQHNLLAPFANVCRITGYMPSPSFLQSFMQRVEEVCPKFSPYEAAGVMGFLGFVRSCNDQGLGNKAAERVNETSGRLMQLLLDCTGSKGMMELASQRPSQAYEVAEFLLHAIGTFDLDLPFASSPERREAWSLAMQALTLGHVGEAGWGHTGKLLRLLAQARCAVQGQWLAEYYKNLDAAAPTLAPELLADAATGIIAAGYQPALVPALSTRLALVLEQRMGQLATCNPGTLVRLLGAVGDMGHVVRTEVLQAAEVVLARPLAAAPEVLREAREQLEAMKARMAAGSGKLEEQELEAVDAVVARATVAVDVLSEGSLTALCRALSLHAYRPGPRLMNAVLAAAAVLHSGTQQAHAGAQAGGWLALQPGWRRLECFTEVLLRLAAWGVQPEEEWLEGTAAALVLLAARPLQPGAAAAAEEYLLQMAGAFGAMARWAHVFSPAQLTALSRDLNRCLELFTRQGQTFDSRISAVIQSALLEAHGSGVLGGSERLQEAVQAAEAMHNMALTSDVGSTSSSTSGSSSSGGRHARRRGVGFGGADGGSGAGAAVTAASVVEVPKRTGGGRMASGWMSRGGGAGAGAGAGATSVVEAEEFGELQDLLEEALSGVHGEHGKQGQESDGASISVAAAAAAIRLAALEAKEQSSAAEVEAQSSVGSAARSGNGRGSSQPDAGVVELLEIFKELEVVEPQVIEP